MNKKRAVAAAAALLVAMLAAILISPSKKSGRPDLAAYARYFDIPAGPGADLRVTFLGVTTLLFDDGETAFMTDGYFSRPSREETRGGPLRIKEEAIEKGLQKFGIQKLAAVIPIHTHYDHGMDSASVAKRTGAILAGSGSAANIGRGYGLEEKQIRTVTPGETLQFGKFKITFILSEHAPGARGHGPIARPLRSPAPMWRYRIGDCYSLIIEHEGRRMLVHGSAGFIPGALAGQKAETVYLGIAGQGLRDDDYMNRYWQETVNATGAKRVVVVHWNDDGLPFDQPVEVRGYDEDDFDLAMKRVLALGARDRVEVRIPVFGQPSVPF